MKPEDLDRIRLAGRPAISPDDGTVLVAISGFEVTRDLELSSIYRIPGSRYAPSEPDRFTRGERDSAPVLSPDGRRVVFLRSAGAGEPAQLFVIPVDGGEARSLAGHPLGAGPVVFSPDGTRVAYLAPVPAPGRYGTDPDVSAEAEPPRHIDRLTYRLDGSGFILDRPEQVFVQDVDPGSSTGPVALTDEPAGARCPVFATDGSAVFYVRAADGPDAVTDEVVRVPVPDDLGQAAGLTEPAVVLRPRGNVRQLAVDGDRFHYLGQAFSGFDYSGRNTSLWTAPIAGGTPRRMTDEETVDIDGMAGPPVVHGGGVLIVTLRKGASSLVRVPDDAVELPLDSIEMVAGGPRVVRSFTVSGDQLVAVVGDPARPGEVVRLEAGESVLTDLAAGLLAVGLARQLELTATAPDGCPVHGFLVLPDGPGPFPVLLDVHGGPHAAYSWGFFDEAQVYAGAGYAVVLPNPRGSAGYGQQHGRSVLGRLTTIDVDDVLALLDAALARPDCDESRVGVMGGSYGGFITSWLASHAKGRFVAGISERAVNAWDSFAGSSDIGYYFAAAYAGSDRAAQWAVSPLAHADQIAIPLLIIHSELDWRCPVEQAQRLHTALRLRGAPVELLLFPGEGHELSRAGHPRHRLQRFQAILQWWDRYLQPGARPS